MSDDVAAETGALHDAARNNDPGSRICSDVVEREARRMCFIHSGWQPETLVAVRELPMGPMGRPVLDWAGAVPAWHLYVPLVKSVLVGVREPTEGMTSCGVDAYPWDRARDQTTDFYVAGMFRAMIDDALGARDCPS